MSVYNLLHYPLQIDESVGGGSHLCTYLLIMGVIIIGLYAGYYIFTRLMVPTKPKQHPCKYCGHIVDAVSGCCHAPVEEKFMAGKCTQCKKECEIICAKCRRALH